MKTEWKTFCSCNRTIKTRSIIMNADIFWFWRPEVPEHGAGIWHRKMADTRVPDAKRGQTRLHFILMMANLLQPEHSYPILEDGTAGCDLVTLEGLTS